MLGKNWQWGKRRQRGDGAAAVELAICLPLLLTICLGCIDFGRFSYSYITVTNACAEAATFGSLHPPTDYSGGLSQWVAAVKQVAVDEGQQLAPPVETSDVEVHTDVLTDGIVRVSLEYHFTTVVPWPTVPSEVTMGRVIVMPQTP